MNGKIDISVLLARKVAITCSSSRSRKRLCFGYTSNTKTMNKQTESSNHIHVSLGKSNNKTCENVATKIPSSGKHNHTKLSSVNNTQQKVDKKFGEKVDISLVSTDKMQEKKPVIEQKQNSPIVSENIAKLLKYNPWISFKKSISKLCIDFTLDNGKKAYKYIHCSADGKK